MNQHKSKPICLGLQSSFGFGDRIGLATPGHVEAMKRAGHGVAPIFPQQSIREMTRTSRTPGQVMEEAFDGMAAAGWTAATGADADHLKTEEDVDRTFDAGFTFYTIDPSDSVDAHADDYAELILRDRFRGIREDATWFDEYSGNSISLPGGTQFDLSEEACMRAAVKYGKAIQHALSLSDYIDRLHKNAGREFEIELSVDETEQPTTLAEHYIIADQCRQHGMRLVSLAPRLIGDFEKGVDYKGDIVALEQSLADHAAIAEQLGPYKISLHSGSDKLSMYSALARATQGRWHVKTAGTSYLEALRVVARHDESLFRQIVDFARSRYEVDKATYHVSATLDSAPPAAEVSQVAQLEQHYLERWSDVPQGAGFTKPGRQILHCTFGSVLTDNVLGTALHSLLKAHTETYTELLAEHFQRHLEALT
ncbi:MAG: tagaturonate epimerase family protein [Planctomycetales bacterium]